MVVKQQRRYYYCGIICVIWLCLAFWLSYTFYGSSIRERAHGIHLPISAAVNKKKGVASTVLTSRNNHIFWSVVFTLFSCHLLGQTTA